MESRSRDGLAAKGLLKIEERYFLGGSHDVNNADLCIKKYKRALLSRHTFTKNISDGLEG